MSVERGERESWEEGGELGGERELGGEGEWVEEGEWAGEGEFFKNCKAFCNNSMNYPNNLQID